MHAILRLFPSPRALALGAVAFLALSLPGADDAEAKGGKKGCLPGMSSILGKFCIDKYEASVVEIVGGKRTRPHSPYAPVDGLDIKAVSKRGVVPQAYISRDQAETACEAGGKRLCTDEEWMTACRGKKPTRFPYGDERKEGYCNDSGVSSFNRYYGGGNAETPQAAYTWTNMNDPRLNQLEGTLAPTGKLQEVQERLRRLRHGRQPARVDGGPRRHLPRRLLPRHPHQRRRLRLPHHGARGDVPRLLDRVPLLSLRWGAGL